MCVTFCHKLSRLYWDHEDCHPRLCEFAGKPSGRCALCRHKTGDVCRLTNTPLPQAEGCCHHNAELIQGLQAVTPAMLAFLDLDPVEPVAEALEYRSVRYHLGENNTVLIDPDELPLPVTYGQGTDHSMDEMFDWSGWYEQWDTEP